MKCGGQSHHLLEGLVKIHSAGTAPSLHLTGLGRVLEWGNGAGT